MTLTYSSDDVSVIVGATIITDFEEIAVTQDEDSWSFSAGSSGEVTRSKNSNKLGSIAITLMQTKREQLQLVALQESDALIPVVIKDNNGASIHVITEATLVKAPDANYGKTEAQTRVWTFKGKLTANIVGGN
jgi:hypothetical protein